MCIHNFFTVKSVFCRWCYCVRCFLFLRKNNEGFIYLLWEINKIIYLLSTVYPALLKTRVTRCLPTSRYKNISAAHFDNIYIVTAYIFLFCAMFLYFVFVTILLRVTSVTKETTSFLSVFVRKMISKKSSKTFRHRNQSP